MILPVDEIDVGLDPRRIRSSATTGDAIAENWQREIAAKPALFDGTVVLLSEFGYAERQAVRPLPRGPLLDLPLLAQGPARNGARTPSRIPCW